MSDEDREELTRGEDFATFERRMMSLFDRMAARVEAEAEESRRRDQALERRAEANEQKAEHREERIQRKIEFLVQQQVEFQAKSEGDMRRLRDLQKQNEEKWARTSDGINALLAIAEMHEREFLEMRQAQAEAQARTDARLAATGERVDALVNTVERLISERRNGGRKEPEGEDE
jgi:hypothetical protein